jgi:hypothetical protein
LLLIIDNTLLKCRPFDPAINFNFPRICWFYLSIFLSSFVVLSLISILSPHDSFDRFSVCINGYICRQFIEWANNDKHCMDFSVIYIRARLESILHSLLTARINKRHAFGAFFTASSSIKAIFTSTIYLLFFFSCLQPNDLKIEFFKWVENEKVPVRNGEEEKSPSNETENRIRAA